MKKLNYLFLILALLTGACKQQASSPTPSDKSDAPLQVGISQHALHEKDYAKHNLSSERQWDSLNGITNELLPNKSTQRHEKFKTFGWHVYSHGSSHKSYNYSLLWGVSYFSYSLDPQSGIYKDIHQWKTTSMVDSAHTHDCKVFLTATNFGPKNNAIFLSNPKAQDVFCDSIIALLSLRKADGLNIDFEGVGPEDKDLLSSFIAKLDETLEEENPDFQLSICLYAVDWNKVFDIPAIDQHIDFYTLMGYDYFGGFSKKTGPVSPLKTSDTFGKGLEASVKDYLNRGVKASKLIVGLPYYGAEWNIKTADKQAEVLEFRTCPSYRVIKHKAIELLNANVHYDEESGSSYLTIESPPLRQVWFEDVQSLSAKYDWIKSQELGGVGIWALGYDNGYPELWDLMAEKFGESY